MSNPKPVPEKRSAHLSEDWLSLIIAFALIVLATLGILGGSGIPVLF